MTNQMTMAQLYAFTKDYLEGATKNGEPSSDFARGYHQALMSLKSVLDNLEKTTGVTK